MKTKFFALAAISSLFMLGACSDDSSSKSMADQCTDGISEDCLVGTWNLESISSLDGSEKFYTFTNPGVLVINDDNTFSYTTSTLTTDPACAGVTNKGKWELENEKIFKFRTTNGDCISETGSIEPEIKVEGETPKMSTKKVLFQQGEKDDLHKGNESEVFSRVL